MVTNKGIMQKNHTNEANYLMFFLFLKTNLHKTS